MLYYISSRANFKMASRFGNPLTDFEVEQLRINSVPNATKASTNWGVCTWKEWSLTREVKEAEGVKNLSTPLLEMKEEDFAYWLTKFILEVRKQNGEQYPPKSLYAFVCSFKRYFEQNGVHHLNPLDTSNALFGNFRSVLDGEMKRLHSLGLGTKVKQAEPITPDEEIRLWKGGQLGTSNARVLLNTVYFYNCKVFGLRSFDEHRNLQCTQFKKEVDPGKHVYMLYTDYGNKANRGGLTLTTPRVHICTRKRIVQ